MKIPIRAAFMCYPGLYPLLMLNYWIQRTPSRIVAIVLSGYEVKYKGRPLSFFEMSYAVMHQAGFRYMLYMQTVATFSQWIVALWNLIRRILGKKVKIKTFEELSKEHGIPIFRSKNFNGPEVKHFLKNVDANLIISAYNNQILKPIVFHFPEYGALNIHPALLPNFRGLDGPFQAMYYRVSHAGVTIHYIDKKIDTGKIVMQEKVKIRKDDSLFSLSIRCWMHGAHLLLRLLPLIQAGQVTAWKQNLNELKYPYESFPCREKVREFLKRGDNLITRTDLKNTLKD